jgi:hypothetical protein
MSNEIEQSQVSRLRLQRLQATIGFAGFLLLVSMTPWASGWEVFVPLAPEWQGIPNAVNQLMPHEVLAIWIVQGWAVLVDTLVELGVLTTAAASALIQHGVSSEQLFRAIALLVLVIGWGASHRKDHAPSPTVAGSPLEAAQTAGVDHPEKTRAFASMIGDRLMQQEILVQNMLLDPQAQPVAESLLKLSEGLRELKLEIEQRDDGR